MMPVYRTVTACYFPCSPQGILPIGYSLVPHLRQLYEYTFDHNLQKFVPRYKYLFYDRKKQMLYIPRNYYDIFMSWLPNQQSIETIDVPPVRPKKVEFGLKPKYKIRDEQKELINFLTDPDRYFKPLAARTGIGKTFCSIASSSELGYVTIIFTLGLVKQWWTEILEKSTLEKHDIWVIQGADSLVNLWKCNERYQPKLIIASTRTWQLYLQREKPPYNELPSYEEFQERFGIGTKIIDEIHQNFFMNLQVDLLSNIKHNIYLSATYERNNKDGRRIFNIVFPNDSKFGDHLVRKYTTCYVIGYTLGRQVPKYYITKDGYNHALYENILRRDKSLRYKFLDSVVTHAISKFFLPNRTVKGTKCLFICITQYFAMMIEKHINYKFPQLKTKVYIGDDESDLSDYDVVISTIKKSGTGRDIPGLKVCVNTVSFKSLPLAKQLFGRLREIPGEDTIYLDYYCKEIQHHIEHVQVRLSRYKDIAKHVIEQ